VAPSVRGRALRDRGHGRTLERGGAGQLWESNNTPGLHYIRKIDEQRVYSSTRKRERQRRGPPDQGGGIGTSNLIGKVSQGERGSQSVRMRHNPQKMKDQPSCEKLRERWGGGGRRGFQNSRKSVEKEGLELGWGGNA